MLASKNNILLTFQRSQFKIHNTISETTQTIVINSTTEDENLGFVLGGAVSPCNNYICVSDDCKGLYLYYNDDCNWKFLRQSSLERRCSHIKFSLDSQYIIIADKSGYILRIPLAFDDHNHKQHEQQAGKDEDKLRWIIMGHVSVLIDFDLHSLQQLIATADRDEKIRISFYPNSYEIYTFLMGHTRFVSQVKFSANGKQLISVGADGYLIIWDLKTKQELYRHKYSSKEGSCIPVVTRIYHRLINVDSESYLQIVTVNESVDGIKADSVDIELSMCVLDAAVIENSDSIDIYIISGTDRIVIDCLTFGENEILSKKENNWLINENFNDSSISSRNKFLETLPKVPLDKTGLQVYYELKEKRLKLNGDVKCVDSDEDIE